MMGDGKSTIGSKQIMALVRLRIDRGGERLWQLQDFRDLPFMAVAQALSRLKGAGALERLSKGIYYRPRETVFGSSQPNPAAIRRLALKHAPIFPAGPSAANLLGFSTQQAKREEIATTALSLPRKLVGDAVILHTRRPPAWAALSNEDAALLDFLRRAGKTTELSPSDTIARTLRLLAEEGRYQRLLKVAGSEPPRVRAILGAMGEQLGESEASLNRLRNSLNPFSRFDFGLLSGLPHAVKWQAKRPHPDETI